ncbi:hypothetical protein [Streptomyces sp. NPDC093984]|uniref:hypothetical protein n=1 Tax=Streptomyces sp. NPDC093984 TaxID=3366052 RepID=UPI003805CE92
MRAWAKGLDRSVAVSVRVHRTDKADAQILVQLLATDFLLGRWLADERTWMLRRVTMRRAH